jgi:hypothetical protein
MKARTPAVVILGLVAVALVVACGSVQRAAAARPASGAGAASGANAGSGPAADPNTNDAMGPSGPLPPVALIFVVRPGADPTAIAHRVAGAQASASPVQPGKQDNEPRIVADRTYMVVPATGHEQEALKAAQADPGVERAFLKMLGSPQVKAQGQ